MFEVPAEIPVTTPVDEFTVATAVLLLLQVPVPPPKTTELAKKVVDPEIHIGLDPVTEAILALGLIVIDCCAVFVPEQPPVMV